MSRGITAVAAAAIAAAALAGCSSPGSGAPASPGAPVLSGPPLTSAALHWRPCPSAAGGAPNSRRLRCADLQVPVNYADPSGRKITLALSEIPATAPAARRQGVLLVNPGGPGASGLSMAASTAAGLSPAVAADYDIVGFDTRGVGSSVPALSCDPAFFSKPRPPYVPQTAAAEQVLVNRAKQYAADCEKRFGWLLPYMTTENLARDMDSIRAALGQQKISYYGVSYGTYLGQVYATLFPHRIRRMILDSVVDPAGVWYADNISQDYAFQGRMTAFFAWIAGNDALFHLGATEAAVNQTFTAAAARLEKHPISGSSGPLIGPDELSDTFLVGGYSNAWWPYLAAGLASYLHNGSSAELLALYKQIGAQNENEFAVYTAVECGDVALAAKLGLLECRHQEGCRAGAVRDVGQRLVQRGVRVLAGQGPGHAAAHQRHRPASDPHAAGLAGRGDALRRRARRQETAAQRPAGRGRGQRQPRPVAGVPA